MHIKLFLFFLIVSLLSVIATGCEETPNGPDVVDRPENARYYSFTINQGTSTPLSQAYLSIQTPNNRYTAYTNSNGVADILIPNQVTLPEYVIVTVDHQNIKPRAFSMPGALNSNYSRSVTCETAPSRVLVREPNLHHLGDDNYGGSENSQLQIPTEGTRRSYTFQINSLPSSMPYIQIFARGVQYRTRIQINGVTTNRLGDSALNGDVSRYEFQLNGNSADLLRPGTNTLTIETGYDTAKSDWDDIEYCSMLLYFP